MAESTSARNLTVNTLLCFVMNKMKKVDVNRLCKSIYDNFELTDIVRAKSQLFSDAERNGLNLPEYCCSPVGSQLEKENELDIILDAIGLLVEQDSLERLPVYVTDDIDRIPYIQPACGELGFLVQKIEKMEAIMKGMQVDVCTLLRGVPSTTTTPGPTVHANSGGGSQTNAAVGSIQASSVQTVMKGGARGRMSTQGKPAVNIANKSAKQPTASSAQPAGRSDVTTRKPTTSSALQREQRCTFSVDSPAENDADYETVMSRKKKLKLRQHERRQTLAIGRSTDYCTAAGAKPFKQVLCIDNVSMSTHEPELIDCFAGLGVRVFTCHEVQARRTAWQRKNTELNHRTFRLCINKADSHLLLNADNLPSDIIVSRWSFKHSKKTPLSVNTADNSQTDNDNPDETFVINDIDMSPGC